MQKSCSFANYKTQRQKFIIPSMTFIERELFKIMLCTTGMSDSKIIRRWFQLLDCNDKEHQMQRRSHSEAHSESHFLQWNSLSVCRMFFGGKNTQPNGQKLSSAQMTTCLVKLSCSAADFGEEPNCSKPPTTLPTRSHSMKLLSLLKAQDRIQKSSFYSCRKTSTEYCSMSQSHIKR